MIQLERGFQWIVRPLVSRYIRFGEWFLSILVSLIPVVLKNKQLHPLVSTYYNVVSLFFVSTLSKLFYSY
jgi:hypothetical protein